MTGDGEPPTNPLQVHQNQLLKHNIFSKWMKSEDDRKDTPFSGNDPQEQHKESIHVTQPVIDDCTEKLTFVQMVSERRQPVSTWKGYALNLYRENKTDENTDTAENLRRVAYEKEGPAIYFPKEKISVVSSSNHYLHPLFTWRQFGIPAPMRFLLDRQPTNFQCFCLPYMLDGKHSIVRIISEPRGKKNELAALREIVTAFTIYEESSWLEKKDASPLVLHIKCVNQAQDDFLQELKYSVQPEGTLESAHKIVYIDKERALELSDHRNLRYVFIDDVSFFSVTQIEKLIEVMPLHCILVAFCLSHEGRGLLSGKVAKSMETVTIRQE